MRRESSVSLNENTKESEPTKGGFGGLGGHQNSLFSIFVAGVGLVLLLTILALSAAILHYSINPKTSSTCSSTIIFSANTTTPNTTNYPALGLPRLAGYSWQDVVAGAYGQTVEFWASSISNYDEWIDLFLAPQVKALYGITIVRVPMSDQGAGQATAQIAAEKAVGNDTTGRVGLVWTNGPDYLEEKSQNLLYGPWTYKIPNAANFDLTSPAIASDFGQPTIGYEFPYNSAQIVFIYNPNCTDLNAGPPQSMAALVNWVIAHPGKFTYANPANLTGDYTGAAFIRHFLYEFSGGYQQFAGSYNEALYVQKVPPAFAQLRAIAPAIYRLPNTTVPFYPVFQSDVDNLFALGEICITLSYDPEHVGEMVHIPQPPGTLNWPVGVKAYVPNSGTIGNVNYVAISYNAKALLGSLVVANFIGSMGAQYKRREITPPGIGTIQAYSPTCDAIVNGGWQIPFDDLVDFPETPSHATLSNGFLPEIDSNYAIQMQIDWWLCVAQNMTTASVAAGGSGAACF